MTCRRKHALVTNMYDLGEEPQTYGVQENSRPNRVNRISREVEGSMEDCTARGARARLLAISNQCVAGSGGSRFALFKFDMININS